MGVQSRSRDGLGPSWLEVVVQAVLEGRDLVLSVSAEPGSVRFR